MKSPVFLLVGDAFLIAEKEKSLLAEIQKRHDGEIPVTRRRFVETPLESILAEARTLPFLAVAQVFRLQDAEKLKKSDLEGLGTYLNHPFPQSFLFFEAGSMERHHPLVKLLEEKSAEISFLEDYEKKPASSKFIREKLKRAGKTMTPDALMRLEESAGEFPAFLDSILEQLITYSGEASSITGEMVEIFEQDLGEADTFALTEAIAQRRTSQALTLAHELIENNDRDAVMLIGLLHWQIRRLWQARVLLDRGEPETGVLKKCRVYPKQAPYFLKSLRTFSRAKIEQALEGLFQLDRQMKTGNVEAAAALESWLVRVTT